MNNLIDFIQEKLKINSKSKINNFELSENIFEFLFTKDYHLNDVKEIINNWIIEYNVDFISILCTLDVLDGVLHDDKSSTIKLKDEYNNTHQNIKIKTTKYDIIKEIRNICIRKNKGKVLYEDKNKYFKLYSLDSIEPVNILLYYSSMIGTIIFLKGDLEFF